VEFKDRSQKMNVDTGWLKRFYCYRPGIHACIRKEFKFQTYSWFEISILLQEAQQKLFLWDFY